MNGFDPSSETGFFRRLADLAGQSEGGRPQGFGRRFRNRLMVGFLVAFPLVVTLFFARFLFDLLDTWFRPVSRHLFGYPVPGIGALLSLVGLYLLGVLATNVLGSKVLGFVERRVSRIPLLSPIYQGVRQVTEVLQARETTQFKKVVLIPFPHPGVLSVGFVTREFGGATHFSGEPSLLVFVPTTPNPTSGFLVAVPRRDVVELDIPVEAGVKLVISGGLLVPAELLEPVGTNATEPRSDRGSGAVRRDGGA